MGDAPGPQFEEAPVPARIETLAHVLGPGGALRARCLAERAGSLVLQLVVPPDADTGGLVRLASALSRIVEADAEPGGVAPYQSMVVRLGPRRLFVQPVTLPGRAGLVAAAPAADDRPGRTRLLLERAAIRLGSA